MLRRSLKTNLILSLAAALSFAASAAQADDSGSMDLEFDTAHEACALVATPGDFILQRSDDPTAVDILGKGLAALTFFKEVLSFNGTDFTYRHSEVITEIANKENFVSMSFYPPSFQKELASDEKKPTFRKYSINDVSYRDSFAVYRVVSYDSLTPEMQLRKRERALERVEHKEDYPGLGTCADFVNWAFGLSISSWWNVIPGVKQLLEVVYPPEMFKSPRDLAESSFSRKTCEIEDLKLTYPKTVKVDDLVEQLKASSNSTNPRIRAHADTVVQLLIEKGVLSETGQPRYSEIRIHHKW